MIFLLNLSYKTVLKLCLFLSYVYGKCLNNTLLAKYLASAWSVINMEVNVRSRQSR